MILKAEAIVLAVRPFSRTSLMVTWLTRGFGRVVTPVKGANRPKSLFLGRIDVAYKSELLFYSRDIRGMHNIRETTPLDCREGLHDNWRAAVAAGYICSLTAQSVETLLDAGGLFDDLDGALARLAGGCEPVDAIIGYEFALLSRLGLKPNFAYCAECSRGTPSGCRFSIPDGRISCIARRDYNPGVASVELTPELHSALRRIQDGVPATSFPERLALGVRRFLGMFIAHHLELAPYGRRAAFAWLDKARAMGTGVDGLKVP